MFLGSTSLSRSISDVTTSSQSNGEPDYPQFFEFRMAPEVAQKVSCKNLPIEDQQVVVYGFGHCLCEDVEKALQPHTQRMGLYDKAAYNEGLSRDRQARICKDFLVRAVVENCRREQEGKRPISIIFCIDTNDNPYSFSVENVLSKTKQIPLADGSVLQANKLITHRELRRAFKLCYSPSLPEEFRKVAKESFRFFRVETETTFKGIIEHIDAESPNPYLIDLTEGKITDLIEVLPPWKTPDWQTPWAESRMQKLQQNKPRGPKPSWRADIKASLGY